MDLNYLSDFGIKCHRIIGDNLQTKWNQLLDVIGDDSEMLWTIGTTVLLILVYWFYAIIYTLMDVTKFPKFITNYKIQTERNDPLDRNKLIKTMKGVFINQTIVGLPGTYVAYHLLLKYRNISEVRILPSLQTFLIDTVILFVLEEAMFYYAHRMLHHKSVYKFVHKQHHEWTAPIAAATFYCHPLEHTVSNMLPVALAAGLMGSHIITSWFFFSMAIVHAMTDHCGYSFPFLPASVGYHDYHHENFNCNYGVFGWMDRLHGTFEQSKELSVQKENK